MKFVYPGKALDKKRICYTTQQIWKIMKIMIFLLTVLVLHVSAKSYAQTVTLHTEKKISVEDALNNITKQVGYSFIGEKDVLNNAPMVKLSLEKATLTEALDKCLNGLPLTFEIEGKIVVLRKKVVPTKKLPALENEEPLEKADIPIQGRVTDSTGNPLVGVTIAVKGTTMGTTTDATGRFSLDVPDNAVLDVSYIGYSSKEVPVGKRNNIQIVLSLESTGLNQLVVVGYGVQKKETVTGSISTVSGAEIAKSPVENIANALVGRVPGLSATQSSGEPGNNAASITIRGVSTMNASGQTPLVIIDGIQSDFTTLNAMDPNNIASISVLKDASATAVYGVRGANGVIIVTTKRGSAGEPKISFTANYGITQLTTRMKMLNSYQYAIYRNSAIENDGNPSYNQYLFTSEDLWKFQHDRDYTPEEVNNMKLTPTQKTALLNSPAIYYTSNDYYAEEFANSAPQNQYNLNISGGSKRVQYFTSVGYFSQLGLFTNANYAGINTNSKYQRYNFRSNYDIEAAKNLKIQINVGGEIANQRGILGQDGDITSAGSRSKQMNVILLASSPFSGPNFLDGKLVTGFVNGANPLGSIGGGGFPAIGYLLTRPFLIQQISNLNTSVKIIHNLDYITKGLSIHGTVAYQDMYNKGTYITYAPPEYTVERDPNDPVNILFIGGVTGVTTVNDNYHNDRWRQYYYEIGINYNRDFGKHSVTGMVLGNAQRTYDPSLLYQVPSGLLGLVGRATYNYDDRYMAEVDMGYNGSENFPPGKRFGLFPAFSGGWIVSNESFFPKNKWVTWLKLRGSYGIVGNDQIGGRRFLYLPSTWAYGVASPIPGSGYYFGNSDGSSQDPHYQGASESQVGNPNVTWEKAKKSDIGLEINFLRNRLSFVGDYFLEKRDNILWPLGTIPALVGTILPPANIGRVTNQGYEIQLGWSDHFGFVNYFIKGNVSFARNKIDYMDEPDFPYPWMDQTGFPIGQYKGFYASGFYNNAEQVNNRPYSTIDGNHAQEGDIRYVDINGDGKLDNSDNIPIGYSNLPEYAFNWSVGASYRGFSISLLFIGTANGSFPITSFYLLNPFYHATGNAFLFQYSGRWTPQKVQEGITPTFPRASLQTYSTIDGATSSFWLFSNNFVRLKNAEISYSFTKFGSGLKRLGVNTIRVYANGNNLYTWDHLISGIDPEQQDSNGADNGYMYPMTRVYNFGINIQF